MDNNAFPQLQRKTSRLVLLAMYCVSTLYQPDVFSDVTGRSTFQLSSCALPGYQCILVSHIWIILRISITIYFRIQIYSDSFVIVVLCSDMLLRLSLCTLYVWYIMCLHKCNYIYDIFSFMMEHQIRLRHCLIWLNYSHKRD